MSFKTRPHYNVTCSNRIEVMKFHVAFSLNVPGYFADDITHVVRYGNASMVNY